MAGHTDELAIRPSFNRYWHMAGAGVAAASLAGLTIFASSIFRFSREEGLGSALFGAGGTLLFFAVMLGWLALYFKNYCLIAGDDYFGRVTTLGRRIVWSRDKLKRIAYMQLAPPAVGPTAPSDEMRRSYLFISDDEVLLAQAPIGRFTQADLDALFQRLGVQPSKLEYVDMADESRYYRGPMRSLLRHPYLWGALLGLVLLAVLITVLAVTTPEG